MTPAGARAGGIAAVVAILLSFAYAGSYAVLRRRCALEGAPPGRSGVLLQDRWGGRALALYRPAWWLDHRLNGLLVVVVDIDGDVDIPFEE